MSNWTTNKETGQPINQSINKPTSHLLPWSDISANPSVNCNNAKAIGKTILEKMVGENVSDFSFKRREQAETMGSGSKNGVKVDGKIVKF